MLVAMSQRRVRVLRQHLQTDRLLGVDVVPVDQQRLNSVPVLTVNGTRPNEPVQAPSRESVSGGASGSDGRTKQQQLDHMDVAEVRVCTKCPLSQSRTQTVFGEGAPDAQLMFIGEGPGQEEDRHGRPFVGRAGEMLNKQIAAMGLERSQVYIANVVKCRPPNNRAPTPTETQACWGYLRRQIQMIGPKVIVTLGGPATKLLLDTKKGITAVRGTWHRFDQQNLSVPVMPTFHPAYLLRAYTPENRKKVWSDLQKALRRLRDDTDRPV